MTDAAVTISLALAVGMIAQSVARHLRIPGIVLLLGAGVLLGPDLADVVRPQALGPALHILVGFAVAVILFEGGLNLEAKRLRREAKVIRRLLSVGALVTAGGAAVAARFVMGWSWSLSALFGTLVIVTGPTVITPLLRRIRLHHRVETVLEAEGVLIDAIGAVIAVVALEVVVNPGTAYASGTLAVVKTLGFGVVLGAIGGLVLALLLRFKKIVPDGLENVFTLSLVLALFQISNAVIAESGIMTVTAAGVVVGNMRTRVQRDLMEFKEQLTVMFIGMLFVLLAADVRLSEIRELGWPGVATVACLMFLVRPLNIFVCTLGSELNLREKAFLSWLAPRGVVAAAVASFFAQTLEEHRQLDPGHLAAGAGGGELRALVFMVIAITVVVQGLSGGIVAGLLGLRRPSDTGFAIIGANELGHAIGRELRAQGQEVVFVDNSPVACNAMKQDGFKVVYGNPVEERTMLRARIEDRRALLAVTTSGEFNYLVGRHVAEDFTVPKIYLALARHGKTVSPEIVREVGGNVLFGRPRDLELWALRLRRGLATVEPWVAGADVGTAKAEGDNDKRSGPFRMPENLLLPLIIHSGDKTRPVAGDRPFKNKDVVHFAIFKEQLDEARAWLREQGWSPAPKTPQPEPPSGA